MINEGKDNSKQQAGDKMPDGTVFAGISPDSGKKMFATPKDGTPLMTFRDAGKYADYLSKSKAFGHDDWRVPTKAELQLLFEVSKKGALKGTFDVSGSDTAGWYWSSTPYVGFNMWSLRFSDGIVLLNSRDNISSVRFIC